MNALDMDLTLAVERECSMLQFREDHEATNERLDDSMMREVKKARQRIKKLRKDAEEEITRIDAEIAALKARKADVQTGAAEAVQAQQRRIAKCRAYLSAGE